MAEEKFKKLKKKKKRGEEKNKRSNIMWRIELVYKVMTLYK
jgi:hypothetical protein